MKKTKSGNIIKILASFKLNSNTLMFSDLLNISL